MNARSQNLLNRVSTGSASDTIKALVERNHILEASIDGHMAIRTSWAGVAAELRLTIDALAQQVMEFELDEEERNEKRRPRKNARRKRRAQA